MKPTVIVVAKAPVAGRVKTRLCPPLTHADAAFVARAALRDTLHAVVGAAPKVLLALDGEAGDWLDGFDVDLVAQCDGGLDARIAAAFEAAAGPSVLVGMDTPQLTPDLLVGAMRALATHDAVIGASADGGFWLLGTRRPHRALFEGVPMSRADTGALQYERLRQHALDVERLCVLRDVDEFDDALAVANLAPLTEFARAFRAVQARCTLAS
jgi:rSAM/selenodomain-associated transferase 1